MNVCWANSNLCVCHWGSSKILIFPVSVADQPRGLYTQATEEWTWQCSDHRLVSIDSGRFLKNFTCLNLLTRVDMGNYEAKSLASLLTLSFRTPCWWAATVSAAQHFPHPHQHLILSVCKFCQRSKLYLISFIFVSIIYCCMSTC